MKKGRRAYQNPGFESERCANPWKRNCRNADIVLYIVYKGRRLPICKSCWAELADTDLEWGESS